MLQNKNLAKTTILFFITLFLILDYSYSQIKTKCIQIEYSNGTLVMNVCIENPPIVFEENSTYTWYNARKNNTFETEGGCAGQLLHGYYTLYYPNGQVREKSMFSLGRKQCESIIYNNKGEISKKLSYSDGTPFWIMEYYKDGSILVKTRVNNMTTKNSTLLVYKEHYFDSELRYMDHIDTLDCNKFHWIEQSTVIDSLLSDEKLKDQCKY